MCDGVASATGGCPFVDAAEAAVGARLRFSFEQASGDRGSDEGHVDRSTSGASAHSAALGGKKRDASHNQLRLPLCFLLFYCSRCCSMTTMVSESTYRRPSVYIRVDRVMECGNMIYICIYMPLCTLSWRHFTANETRRRHCRQAISYHAVVALALRFDCCPILPARAPSFFSRN